MPSHQVPDGHADQRMALVAERFVALSDILVDDFDVVELLDRMAADCVELLGVSAAAILLRSHDDVLEVVASSNEASRLMEVFQLEREEGPCIDAVSTGRSVIIDDLATMRHRWPDFATEVARVGFNAVYALPLRLNAETIGALNLFNNASGFTGDDERLAQAFADVASIAIFQQRSTAHATLLAEQLQRALTSRIVIEQAKGVIAEYGGIDVGSAFLAIRSYARGKGAKLSGVAADLVERRLNPALIVTAADHRKAYPS